MITIRPLTTVDLTTLSRVISGYESNEKYVVSWDDSAEASYFTLRLVDLLYPYVKRFPLEDPSHYVEIIKAGYSLAAYDSNKLVALALANIQSWNNTFWLHEFHVQKGYQGRGIGRQLMNAVKTTARAKHTRAIVCETQTTNVPAIRFYRTMGFKIEGVDVSLYSNHDLCDPEVALFMKYRLP